VTDLTHHETRKLDENLDLYWKILEDSREIEIIMKVCVFKRLKGFFKFKFKKILIFQGKTSSYIGLGWRPQGTESSCQAFPNFVDTINVSGESLNLHCTILTSRTQKYYLPTTYTF